MIIMIARACVLYTVIMSSYNRSWSPVYGQEFFAAANQFFAEGQFIGLPYAFAAFLFLKWSMMIGAFPAILRHVAF